MGGILLTVLVVSVAGAASDPPVLAESDLSGLEIVRQERYEGKALYGYIDGGAELYREYGFVCLVLQEIAFRGEQYSVEVYRMKDELAALGIYSVSRGDCEPVDSLGIFSCLAKHQVQWASSVFYVRIINTSGSSTAQSGGVILALVLERKCRGMGPKMSSILEQADVPLTEVKYIRGPLGFQNGFDSWSSLVDEMQGYEAYLVTLESPGGQMTIGDTQFRDQAGMHLFLARWSARQGPYLRMWEISPTRLLVLESESPAESMAARLEKSAKRARQNR
jgi:hypothetical protein